mgnify:CR=1 FL=1
MDNVKLVEVEQRSKSNTKRIDKIDKQIEEMHELMQTVASLTTEIKYMRKEFNEGLSRITRLEQKPVENYNKIVMYIITTILGALLGAMVKGVIK